MPKTLTLLIVLLASGCSSYFFYPSRELVVSPDQIGVSFEEVYLQDPDQPKLHGWLLPALQPKGVVLFLHGNAENISTHFRSVYWLPDFGYTVFLFDYRGYGSSQGTVDIEGVHADVGRAIRYIQGRFAEQDLPVVLFGQSLGGAIALYTAGQEQWRNAFDAVVVEAPFSSYRQIAQEKIASLWLTYPFQHLLALTVTDQFSPLEVVERIAPTPLLFVHGDRDEIVPLEHSLKLYDKAGTPKQIWVVEGGQHISVFQNEYYRGRLLDFLEDTTGETPDRREYYVYNRKN